MPWSTAIESEVEGVARLDPTILSLEFRTKDTLVGALKSAITEVCIPLTEIDSISFKKGLFGAELIIRARSMKAVEKVPGNSRGELHLQVSRKYRQAAAQLAAKFPIEPGA